MKLLTAAFAAVVLSLTLATSALALPPATVTVAKVSRSTYTFTSSPCLFGFCGWSWRGYGLTSNRLGFTMGNSQTITYTFTPGVYSVVVTVGGRCSATSRSNCPVTGQAFGIVAK